MIYHSVKIRDRQIRESDPVDGYDPSILKCRHVAWIDGEPMDCWDKNTGESDAEAIGNLIVSQSYQESRKIVIHDVILEDCE